jgi:hypothetical protein
MVNYNDFPLMDCIKAAQHVVAQHAGHAVVFHKFTCAQCGARQTCAEANRFFTHATCEECGGITDIQISGCNMMTHAATSVQQLRAMYGNYPSVIVKVDCNDWMKEQTKGQEP